MREIIFANTRELKNRTNELLRKAAGGSWVIITRRGKPVASLKPFSNADLQEEQSATTLYRMLRDKIAAKQPRLPAMTAEELRVVNESLSARVQAFPSWEAMDRAAKGDPYGISG
ncbi:MAG: type II toxin-antitoxin system prevent-host-death family antitoxin [Bacillota bacterium]|nr:type II toxin-antitoxin system prevent-host-death family antitoxin [Thermoanaerobacteraceae bacterium]